MLSSVIGRIGRALYKTPAPRALVALYLSLRWGCRVSPSARIDWPGNLRIGRHARLYACRIMAQGVIDLGAHSELHDYAYLDTQAGGRIAIGSGSAVGPFTTLFGAGGVTIGAGCSIAGHSMIVSSTHTIAERERPIRDQGYTGKPIILEDDVWLGANCTVLPGTVIGRGAVVGAGSLVRTEVPPMVVAGGNPLRIIRER